MIKHRICFIMPGSYPLFNPKVKEVFGGSEVELYNMAKYFSIMLGYKVDFLVGDYGQKNVEYYDSICVKKMKYFKSGRTSNPLHKVLKILLLIKSLFFQKSDIYITKTAGELLGWMVIITKWIRGKTVIFRLGSDKDTELKYWKKKSKRLYYLYKLGLYNCHRVICQSQYQREQMLKSCGLNGIVIKNMFCLKNSFCVEKKEYVLWVSRCMALKRPLLFLEMARLVPEENFVMIMPSNSENKVYEDEKISDLAGIITSEAELIPNLVLIDYVPFERIQFYYNNAKIFVNTSEYEGFPNSFIQACLGKTGILSLKVNPDNFITKNKLGYCCQDNFLTSVNFIRHLDEKAINEYGDNAYAYIRENHNIEIIAQQYIKIFEQKAMGRFARPNCISRLHVQEEQVYGG